MLHQGRLFLSDISFNFVRSIEHNASRDVFIEILFSPYPILLNIKAFLERLGLHLMNCFLAKKKKKGEEREGRDRDGF